MAIPPRKGFALDLPHPIGHMRRCKRPTRPAMILLVRSVLKRDGPAILHAISAAAPDRH
jgi:hypothetical protein